MSVRMFFAGLCLFLISQSSIAQTESPINTGNSIFPYCTSKDSGDQILCLSFVTGTVLGANLQMTLDKAEKPFCTPERTNPGQMLAVFNKYLSDHPEQRHLDAVVLIFLSMKKAFPCAK